jgi:hypothetical protein
MIEDALRDYNQILSHFAKQEFDSETLRHFISPGIPQMSKGPAPDNLAFWFETESTVTVRTKESWLGVIWWPKPPAEEPVLELHLNPYDPLVPYDEFITRLNLGEAVESNQGHPLADIQKIHLFQGLKVIVNQIAYSDSIGLVGEIHLHRIFS